MARSRPFGLFVLILCLVACVCAHADVSEADAKKAVGEAQTSAKKVFEDAKGEVSDTLYLRRDANTCKLNAEEAAEEAEKAAKGNPKAEAIAQKAKNASDEVLQLYAKASELATKYLESMRKLRTKAQQLDKKAENDLYISSWRNNNYTKIKEEADIIKAQVDALNRELQKAMGSFGDLANAQNEMLKPATEAQLARYHVDAIVAVAKVETGLESAERDMKLIEQKRDEINATVQEMKTLYDNSPKDLIHYISHLQFLVEGDLRSASLAFEEAKKAKESMPEPKKRVDDALVKVSAETDVENAKKEASNAYWAVKDAEKQVDEIKKALESATTSTSDALFQKNVAVNSINAKTKKPDVTQENDKTNPPDSENTHQPVKDTTESPVESGTKQPIITNPDQSMSEQPVQGTTESPDGSGTKQPTTTYPDQAMSEQPVQGTTESPDGSGTKQPTTTNSDQPGSGGTEATQIASKDSAMTVSLPLLFALIACVALH